MSLRTLRGSVAVVTGGATRVGASIVRALASEGCEVLIHCRSNVENGRKLADEIAVKARRSALFAADLSTADGVAALAAEAERFAGERGVRVLVHSAANFDRVDPKELTAEHWERAMALNATAPYLLTLALRASLERAEGAVVGITCTSAERPWKNYVPYSVSKAAHAHTMKALALALAPKVRCNCIAPGTVMAPESYEASQLEALRGKIPLQRFGEADDVARAVVFLASNDFVTGATITVDGGRVVG